PAQLSGGQRQRIALARALAVQPQVLLLDEPFGALDAKVRKELRRWLRNLHEELHVTSIFVTHDQEEALEVADRVVLMNHGKVEQQGAPEAVYNHPASPFVYGFLGSVNLFHGRVEEGGVQVGSVRLATEADFAAGVDVLAFARPHELNIVTDLATEGGLAAKVTRVLFLGSSSRVELEGLEQEQYFEVEVPLSELARLDLTPGQEVRIVPSRLRLFEQEALAG
ncbi:MAG TPA: TOBE-like domain-containing protein, partial [Hyphomicrobiales bacterium]|nr:TOBE-like domain-containing protein [Hyphomicrobiales bacterium]